MTTTILAVDDSPESLRVFVGVLTAEGYEVRQASSGELALASAASAPPDLILLDVRMRGISGFDVCRRLKAAEETRHIPVILVSASADVSERVEGMEAGAADYIAKPFLRTELLARVRTQLALAQTGARLTRVEGELRRSLDRAERARLAMLSAMEDQKRAAAQVMAARDFHLQLLSRAPALIWRAGLDGKCDWFNATWLAFTGRTLAQELGDGWAEGVHADDMARCLETYLTAFAARQRFEMEYRLRRHDGEYRWILDIGIPFETITGEFGGYIGYCFDVTDRRTAAETVLRQKQLIETVLENAPIGFAVNRIDSGVGAYISARFEDIYGVPRGSLQTADDFFNMVYTDPEQREHLRARIMADMATGDAARMRWEDIPLTTASGERKVVSAINIPVLEQNLMVSTVQDVTASHAAARALQQQAEELRDSNADLARFNRAAVDRELRMIALKGEVNELLRRMGEAPRYREPASDPADATIPDAPGRPA